MKYSYSTTTNNNYNPYFLTSLSGCFLESTNNFRSDWWVELAQGTYRMPWCSQMGEPLGLAEVAGARRIRYREEGEAEEEGERARAWSFSGRELRDQLRFSYNLIPKACAVVMILSHGSQLFFLTSGWLPLLPCNSPCVQGQVERRNRGCLCYL